MKTYFTFGQDHVHYVGCIRLDRDCVAVVSAVNEAEARRFMFSITDGKFCFSYPEEHWDPGMMQLYPRGYVCLDATLGMNGS